MRIFSRCGNSFTRNFKTSSRRNPVYYCALSPSRRGERKFLSLLIDLPPFGTHFPALQGREGGGENGRWGRITVQRRPFSIHGTDNSWRMNEHTPTAHPWVMGFCHISIDVESSTHSPRSTLARYTPFVQPGLRNRSIFADADLHSDWPRLRCGRRAVRTEQFSWTESQRPHRRDR